MLAYQKSRTELLLWDSTFVNKKLVRTTGLVSLNGLSKGSFDFHCGWLPVFEVFVFMTITFSQHRTDTHLSASSRFGKKTRQG